MANADKIEQEIRSIVDRIKALVEEQAHAALTEALGRSANATPAKRGPGRPAKAAAKATPSGKRVRRTAEDLEAIQSTILAALKKSPGLTSEGIQQATGLTKKDVQRPLVLLRESRQVRTKGEKRATQYFAK